MCMLKAKLMYKILNNMYMSPVYISGLFQSRCIEKSVNNLQLNLRYLSRIQFHLITVFPIQEL